MLHYVVIGGLTLAVIACVVMLFSIKSEPSAPKLPPDLKRQDTDRTHFYEAIRPERPMPPVPPFQRSGHAAEPKTDIIYYGPVSGQPQGRRIPPRVY